MCDDDEQDVDGSSQCQLHVAVAHADVVELEFKVVAWNDRSNEVDVITMKECQLEARTYPEKNIHNDAIWRALCDYSLKISASRCT